MPIVVLDSIVPGGSGFSVAEDVHVKGGYKSVADVAARDAIPASRCKVGMRVLVEANDTEYVVSDISGDPAVVTWAESNLLRTTEQTLSRQQQIVARQNIGAGAFNDASGFPAIASRGEIVPSGGFTTPAAGTAFGMSAPVGAHTQVAWLSVADKARVWNDTTVRKVQLYVPSTLPADAELHIDFWRDQGDGRHSYVGTTGDIRSLVTANNTVQTVTLTTPVPGIRMGDRIGGHLVYTSGSWGAGVHAVAASSDQVRYAYSVELRDGTPWMADGVGTVANSLIPVICHGDSPVFAIIGDSRIDGYDGSEAMTKGQTPPVLGWHAEADPAYQLSELTGLSCRNYGVSGNDTGEMLVRIASITESKAAYYIICTGYYNDAYNPGRDKQDFLDDVQAMIDACLADGGRVIVVPDWPFKDPMFLYASDTDIQNEESDEFMGDLAAVIKTNYSADQVLWADCRNYMGVERPNTGSAHWHAYNRWDLNPLFASNADVTDPLAETGSKDLLHWSAAGAEAFSRALVSEIRPQLRTQNVAVPQSVDNRPLVLGDAGDASTTMTASGRPVTILQYRSSLTANRTVTLPASGNKDGDIIRVVRLGLGSGTLDVGGLTRVPAATQATVEVTFSEQDDEWFVSGYQELVTISDIDPDLPPMWEDVTPSAPMLVVGDFNLGSVTAPFFAGHTVADVSAVSGFSHRYLMAFSPDHETVSGNSGIWFAGSDDLTTWVPLNSGNRVTALNGMEFPDLVVSGSTVYVFAHKYNGGSPNVQATFVSSSTSGLGFGTPTEVMTPLFAGGHTGYSKAWHDGSQWNAFSLLVGGSPANCSTRWTAASPAGPWTNTGERFYAWKFHVDGLGEKQAQGGDRYWSRGGAKFVIATSQAWAGGGSGAATTRAYQIKTGDDGRGALLPAYEFHEASLRTGQWNSGWMMATQPLRHTDGRLYMLYVGMDGGGVRGVGLLRADETQAATELPDYSGTAVDLYDASGRVVVGAEYQVLNASDGIAVTPSTSAYGSLAYDSGTGLYTLTGTNTSSGVSVHFPGHAADFTNDLEITLELFGLLHPYVIDNCFWSMGVSAAQAGAKWGWFIGTENTFAIRTYGTSPASTDTQSRHDRNFGGMDVIRANVRQNWRIGLRPNLGHVWVVLDDWASIIALTPSASVMGRTGNSVETMLTLNPRVTTRTLTFSNMRLTRRR